MKIVFLTSVHPLLTYFDPLPRWQMEASRIRALEEMGHKIRVIRYTPRSHIRLNLLERIWWNFRVTFNVIKQIATPRRGEADNDRLIIFSLGADVLLPITIRLIKLISGAKLIVMSGVSPITSGNPRERAMARDFDLVLTNDDTHSRQWIKLGAIKAINLPLSAMDPELHYRRKVKKDIDLLFVGTLTQERNIFLNVLRTMLPKNINFVVKEFIWEEEYARLMSRARIIINPLRKEMKDGANLRMFEVPAFGGLLLGNSGRKEWLRPGREMIVYKDVKDAVKEIIYYLKNKAERERIAKNGMLKAKCSRHT